MKIAKAEISLTWDNGRTVKIGTIEIEAVEKQFKTKGRFMQRLGWELVRKGFVLMFSTKKWKTDYNP